MPAFKPHETQVVDVAWDAGAQKTKVRSGEKRAYYAQIYAWYDPNADEGNKSDYKFIHHEVSANGDPGDAVTKACTLGIGVLNGGMGGTNIPGADRQGVYDHLAEHLRDGGREPPELQSFDEHAVDHTHTELLRHVAMSEPWAMWPVALRALLASRLRPRANDETIETWAVTRPGPKSGRLARIPIIGPISRRDSLWSQMFGGTSVEGAIKMLRAVAAEDAISTVLLDVDSPGGTVAGVPELAHEVRRLGQSKHVVALANSLAASAAYWIASQADEIVATPEALVGSVGVFAVHEDWSKAEEMAGVKLSYISAGKYKVEGNFDEPLTDEARASMQAIVDDAYRLFTEDVAQGRQVSAASVRSGYGEGRVLTAKDAKASGLIDRVASYGETIARLTGNTVTLNQANSARSASIVAADGSQQMDDGETMMGEAEQDMNDAMDKMKHGAQMMKNGAHMMNSSNSQAQHHALQRRRLEIAQKTFLEEK